MLYKTPDIVKEQREKLYDLCQNHHKDGLLTPRQVAEFLGKDYQWMLNAIYSGAVPFAFGTNKSTGRGNCCIPVLPFWEYMTQHATEN